MLSRGRKEQSSEGAHSSAARVEAEGGQKCEEAGGVKTGTVALHAPQGTTACIGARGRASAGPAACKTPLCLVPPPLGQVEASFRHSRGTLGATREFCQGEEEQGEHAHGNGSSLATVS